MSKSNQVQTNTPHPSTDRPADKPLEDDPVWNFYTNHGNGD